jgi:hypothetical protein
VKTTSLQLTGFSVRIRVVPPLSWGGSSTVEHGRLHTPRRGHLFSQIQAAIDAAAAFGSAEKRLEIQTNFVSRLMDSMTAGIGALVDADMEAASARLNALTVQQQLGLQSLAIANSNPQGLLSLFR